MKNLLIILSLIFSTNVFSQSSNSTIQGQIFDPYGEYMLGATVLVKGTENGAFTDFEGKFFLSNIPPQSTLLIQYPGFKAKEITIDDSTKSNLTIELEEENCGCAPSPSVIRNRNKKRIFAGVMGTALIATAALLLTKKGTANPELR